MGRLYLEYQVQESMLDKETLNQNPSQVSYDPLMYGKNFSIMVVRWIAL